MTSQKTSPTNQRIHFITGLPRSGSTLLSALLLQNPRFHAGMTSGLGGIVTGMLDMMGAGSELGLLVPEEQRRPLIKTIFESFRAITTDRPVYFDTNRIWTARTSLLHDLYPNAKLIACVRDVPWIMDSMERVFRKNPYEMTRVFGPDINRATVYSRIETLGQNNRLVGQSWTALKDGFYGEHSASILVLEYDLLAAAPKQALRLVYDFIGEPWFDEHDTENVTYDAPDFDAALGIKGMHKVSPTVQLTPRKTVLPPDLFAKFEGMDFWRDPAGTNASIVTRKE